MTSTSLPDVIQEAEAKAKVLAENNDYTSELTHLIQFSRLLVQHGLVPDALWYSTRGLALSDAGYGTARQRLQLIAIREYVSDSEALEKFWRNQYQKQGE